MYLREFIHTHNYIASGFVLAPVSQNITVGATVHFTCQHTDGDVFWRINGEDVNNYPAASYNSRRGLNTLTIRNATADYDGAEMQCLGLFGNSGRGPESTRPAILRLQGLWCTNTYINKV